jgi:D-alanine transaminase
MPQSAPPRIVYAQGQFLPLADARVPVMDRGFLFGDGVYEVTAVLDGRFVDNAQHLARLDRSLAAIGIRNPHAPEQWTALQRELVQRNGMREGIVYIQVTRGAFEREFLAPEDIEPNVVMFTQHKNIRANPAAVSGVAVVSVPDLRWARRDIKSTSLLAQVLAKQAARDAGVSEAWMVEDGKVTEGASSTAFIITQANEIVTRPLSQAILPGVTRLSVLALAEAHRLSFIERPFSIDEAMHAKEAFLTSASTFVMPVVTIDGHPIADGKPGPLTRELRKLYFAAIDAQQE